MEYAINRNLQQHHDQVACMQSTKESIDLDKTLKYYDKGKDIKLQQLESQERELKQVLQDLKEEKEYHKRRGSVVGNKNPNETNDSSKHKSKKGVVVKLSPGKIDTESTSPPNAHDVAVRMLFDKKKKHKKKKLLWKKEKEAASKVVGMEEEIPKSQSARNATFKLPVIETQTRRGSIDDPQHHKIRKVIKQAEKQQEETKMPLKSEEEYTKTYRKTPYPVNVITNQETDVTAGDILTVQVAIDEKPVSVSVNMKKPPKEPRQAWEKSTTGENRTASSKSKNSRTTLPDLPNGKSSLVELQTNNLPCTRSRRGSDFSRTNISDNLQRKRSIEKDRSISKGSFSGCRTEEDGARLQKYIQNREACARRYSLRHEDDNIEREHEFEYDPHAQRHRRHSHAGADPHQRRASLVSQDSDHKRRGSLGSHDSAHSRRGSLGSHDSAHSRRGSLGSHDSAHSRRGSLGSHDSAHSRRGSRGGSNTSLFLHDPQIEEFMRHLQQKYGSSNNKDQLQISSLQRYYELLCESENTLMQDDCHFDVSSEAHKPLCTLKRSQRRKMMALEAMIKQLPSFKDIPKMDPQEMLNCSYLRLSQNAVEELEDQCRREGIDPGIHAHMNEQQVEDYFTSHHLL